MVRDKRIGVTMEITLTLKYDDDDDKWAVYRTLSADNAYALIWEIVNEHLNKHKIDTLFCEDDKTGKTMDSEKVDKLVEEIKDAVYSSPINLDEAFQ